IEARTPVPIMSAATPATHRANADGAAANNPFREHEDLSMADDPRLIRGIDFKSAFPFTLIFRSFRIAVHPSKLILALAALVMIYVGGKVMDRFTPTLYKAVPDELSVYGQSWNGANPAEN